MLPFPPTIKVSDIIKKREPCKIALKGPNAFIIYRKAFLNQLYIENHNLKMTEVSKLVSIQWKNETEIVKEAYRKISREVEIELSEKRKEGVTANRIVWKNSKYPITNKCEKMKKKKKVKGVKSQINSHDNIIYQFVSASPNVKEEITSNNEDKNVQEVIFCNSPDDSSSTNSDTLEFIELNDFTDIYYLEYDDIQNNFNNFNNNNNNNNLFPNTFIEQPKEYLIFNENIQKFGGIYDYDLNWYFM